MSNGVLKAQVSELVDYECLHDDVGLPRPSQDAPPFASWFEPRVAGLSPELVVEIRGLSITVNEQGELVDRPVASFVPEAAR